MRRAIRRNGLMILVGLALLAVAGCGGSDPSASGPAANVAGGPPPAATPPLEGPAASAFTFLEGARSGDDAKVASMLTAVARRELAKRGLSVAPPCTDTAKFVLGEVRYASAEVAQVASRWTDLNPATGEPQSSDMTWVLRKEEGQWRIGGMALTVFEGEPPLLLNFEDPDEMLRQRQMLKEEIARRAQSQQPSSTSPAPPGPAPSSALRPGAPSPR